MRIDDTNKFSIWIVIFEKVLDMGTGWEYTYAAWMTDMRISQESISDQLFKKDRKSVV